MPGRRRPRRSAAVLREQQLAEFPGPARRRRVALMSRHDRALHQDVPFPRERIDVADSELGREAFYIAPDIRQVLDGCLMDRMLLSIGLRRERDFYVTNILPFRPPGNRTPTDPEIALFLPFVLRHVELAAPRVLVLLGGTSAKALLRSREGITRLRGRWHEVAPRGEGGVPWPALATLHPAYLLRNPSAKREAWHDLLLLRRRLDAG